MTVDDKTWERWEREAQQEKERRLQWVQEQLTEDKIEEKAAEAKSLVKEGWVQTSAKFRKLVRLPDESCFETLCKAYPGEAMELINMLETWSFNHLLHLSNSSAEPIGCRKEDLFEKKTLDLPTFRAYKKAGGGRALQSRTISPTLLSLLSEEET